MVMAVFGVEVSEVELRQACDCTPVFGTNSFQAVLAARQLGFPGSFKANLTPEDLADLLAEGLFPVALVNLYPLTGQDNRHALVLVEVSEQQVQVHDPLQGPISLDTSTFLSMWQLTRNLAVIIRR
jgi:ABC-type bacteriocin/lantibiotic exporter with double-glycine peptidase domain